MNLTDFVKSIVLDLDDYENIGKVGFIEGMSNVIIRNLNMLDVTMRPVHSVDPKRDVLYLKEDGTWEKSEEEGENDFYEESFFGFDD
jgi:hypothetical protein